jgi:hypothetical protein
MPAGIPGIASVSLTFPLSCAVAALGIAAGIVAGHRGSDASGAALIVPDSVAVATAPQRATADWLADAGRDLGIGPDQAAAWQSYAETMKDLQMSRVGLEQQQAAGGGRDIASERARHAMVLAAALAELQRHLSPEQQTRARLLTRILAETVICRELAVR